MEYHVCGNPITEETLKGMPEYNGKDITRKDLAQAALNMKNVEECMKIFPIPTGKFTSVWIYNATGSDMILKESYFDVKSPLQTSLMNGQWAHFNHDAKNDVSRGGIVYEGESWNGNKSDWMAAWDSEWHVHFPEYLPYLKVKTYCQTGQFFNKDSWKEILPALLNSGDECEYHATEFWAHSKIRPHYLLIGGVPHAYLEATFGVDNN